MDAQKKPLMIAIATTLVGAAGFVLYMRSFENSVRGGALVSVTVATQDIPLGMTIDASMLGMRVVPSKYVEPRHIRSEDAKKLIGVRIRTDIKANETLMWSDLATATERRRDLASLVQSGRRAVSISADEQSSFGGLLRPGDRVDVLLTIKTFTTEGRPVTKSILQNMLVLATGGTTLRADQKQGERHGYSREVTLSATLEQSQMLKFAATRGSLSLVLRNPDDVDVYDRLPETSEAELADIVAKNDIAPAAPVAQMAAQAAPAPTPAPARPHRPRSMR